MVSASRSLVVFTLTNNRRPRSQSLEIWHFLPTLDRIVHGYTTSLQTFPMVKLRPRPSLSDSPTLRVSLFRFDHRCKIKKLTQMLFQMPTFSRLRSNLLKTTTNRSSPVTLRLHLSNLMPQFPRMSTRIQPGLLSRKELNLLLLAKS